MYIVYVCIHHPLYDLELLQGLVVFDSQREFAEFQIYG